MHVRTHADHFPPLTMMLIFHQPIIIPSLPHNYAPHVVDFISSTNYGVLLFAKLRAACG